MVTSVSTVMLVMIVLTAWSRAYVAVAWMQASLRT